MTTPTVQTFIKPETLIFETAHWAVALRPKQVTLGAMVLVSRSATTHMGGLTSDETADLATAWAKISAVYDATLQPEKINYLALMMVDPNPHFHVIPRYAAPRAFDGGMYNDSGWPKLPDMNAEIKLTDAQRAKLVMLLRSAA